MARRCRFSVQIDRLLDGELFSSDRKRLEDHVGGCPLCLAARRLRVSLKLRLLALRCRIGVPKALAARVVAALAARPPDRKTGRNAERTRSKKS